jgi:ADP-ribose pyrophosphatase YjhB (NUDIX family)
MTNLEISTAEAKQDKLFYVVANIVIVDVANASCLLLKRSESEKVLGCKWAFPGGKLEHKDVAQLLEATGNEPIQGIDNILGKLAMREGKEECGLDVSADDAAVIKNKVFVRPDGVPVFMTTLATTYEGGEVKLEDGAFSEYAWSTNEQLSDYDCIPGVQEEARKAIELFRKA